MSVETNEIRVPETARADFVVMGVVLFVGVLSKATPYLPDGKGYPPNATANDHALSWILTAIWSAFLIWVLFDWLRRRGGEVILDANGIRREKWGGVVWQCAWNDFGGWKSPSQFRAEVFDRQGHLVGSLLAVNKTGKLGAKVLRELDRRTPEGGIRNTPPKPPKSRIRTTVPRCWAVIGIGLATAALGSWALVVSLSLIRNPESISDGRRWLASFPSAPFWTSISIFLGVGLAAFGGLGLLNLKHPGALGDRPPTEPKIGPTLSDFLLDCDSKPQPINLAEGLEYRYVDSEALRRKVAPLRGMGLALGVGGGGFFLIVAVGLLLDPTAFPAVLIVLVIIGACVLAGMEALRTWRWFLPALDDVIGIENGFLIVLRDGRTMTYPLGSAVRFLSRLSPREFGYQGDRYGSEGDFYYLDSRYLWASNPPDGAA